MEEHVAHEDELEEEQTTEAVGTPTFTDRQTCKKRYCNVYRNNEIMIWINFQPKKNGLFVVAVLSRSQRPPCPVQRRTRSMVHEGTQITQPTKAHGSVDTLQNDEFEMPLLGFLNRKKKVTRRENCKISWLVFYIDVNMKRCLYGLPSCVSMFICLCDLMFQCLYV